MKLLFLIAFALAAFAETPKTEAPKRLTEVELLTLQNINLRQQIIERDFKSLQEQRVDVTKAACKRVGLPEDCELQQDGTLVARKPPEAAKPEANGAPAPAPAKEAKGAK